MRIHVDACSRARYDYWYTDKYTATFGTVKRDVDVCTPPRPWLWPPYVIGGPLYLCPVISFYPSSIFLFSSPNLSGRRLDVYHTLTHGVALVRI